MTTLQLLGLKHTGKSSLGRLFAARRGWTFLDLDTLLEAAAGGQRSARQIYLDEGRDGFQRWEAEGARRAAERLRQGRAVLAWGGGTVTNPLAVEELRALKPLVLLTDRTELLYQRILRSGRPAFLSEQNPWQDFQALVRERSALLEGLTPWHLDLNGGTLDQAAQDLDRLWDRLVPATTS